MGGFAPRLRRSCQHRPSGRTLSSGTEIAGALIARRFGYEAAILVRVDDGGEVYARLAEDGDTTSPALRALTNEDDDE
jgi:hypothetical protein